MLKRPAQLQIHVLILCGYVTVSDTFQSQLSLLTVKTQAEPPKKCACFVLTDGTRLLLILLGSYSPYSKIVSLSERLSNSETDE